MQNRQTMLAETKARSEEYRAQKAAGTTPASTTTSTPAGGFSF